MSTQTVQARAYTSTFDVGARAAAASDEAAAASSSGSDDDAEPRAPREGDYASRTLFNEHSFLYTHRDEMVDRAHAKSMATMAQIRADALALRRARALAPVTEAEIASPRSERPVALAQAQGVSTPLGMRNRRAVSSPPATGAGAVAGPTPGSSIRGSSSLSWNYAAAQGQYVARAPVASRIEVIQQKLAVLTSSAAPAVLAVASGSAPAAGAPAREAAAAAIASPRRRRTGSGAG